MKATALFLAMFAASAFGQAPVQMPAIPFSNPDPDFPLQVHIVTVRWGGDTVHLYRSLQGEMHGGNNLFS